MPPTTCSDRFLAAFSEIESSLRARLDKANGLPFGKLVSQAALVSPEVRRYEYDLKEFGELRNAIVHDRGGGRVIAEPHEDVVAEIRAIADAITKPPTVAGRFEKPVITVDVDDPVARASQLILQHSFSQLPVLRGGEFVGLLTTNTIARWIGACGSTNCAPHQATSIGAALGHAEDPEPYMFIGNETTLAQVLELFADRERSGRDLAALLITPDGRRGAPMCGIMTMSDLPKVLRELPDLLPPRAEDA